MSCALCRLARTACNKEQPCGRCVRMGMAHHCFRPPSKRGRPPSRAPRPSEGQPVPLLPLHPAGAVGPDHAGLVASASNTPHLVPTATLFAAGMGTPLPSGLIHPAGDYDSSLALSSTALSTSVETSTSTSTSSPSSTTSSSNTSALVLGSISEVKSELAEVKDELSAVHMMQMEMREMKRRLGQLEEDNASLKGTVIELRTQVGGGGGGGGGARFGQFRVDAAGGQQGPPLKKIRWMGHEALSPEMLWCFPFLEHINISRSNFVVDDLEKAILVLSFYPGKWTESTAFANQQFCNVSGFSLAELLERELVSVVAMADKLRIVRGWIKGKLTGYGDIVHCSYYIEHKAGHLVKVAARIQFFFDTTTQINYSVWCIDEVLGSEMPSVPFKEVRAKEMAEWHEASRSITINGAVPSIQPAAVAAALAGGNGAAAATATSTTTTPLAHTPQPHTQHTPPQHPTPPSQPSPQQQQQQQQQHYPPLHHSHSPPFQHHHHHHHQGQSKPQPQPQQHSPPYTQHHPHQQHQQQHQHQHQQHQQHQHSHQPRPSEPQAQHHSPTYQQHQAYPAQLQGGGGGGGQTQSPPYTHAQHLQQQLQLQHQQNQRHQPYQLYQQQQQQQLQLLLMQQDELDLLQQQQQQQHQQHQQLATPTAEADEWREFLSISPSPSPGVFNYPGPPT